MIIFNVKCSASFMQRLRYFFLKFIANLRSSHCRNVHLDSWLVMPIPKGFYLSAVTLDAKSARNQSLLYTIYIEGFGVMRIQKDAYFANIALLTVDV